MPAPSSSFAEGTTLKKEKGGLRAAATKERE
jgi:hypothetical protein